MVAMSCKAWLSSQSWLCVSSALVASGLSSSYVLISSLAC
jgi:hypothetical protein